MRTDGSSQFLKDADNLALLGSLEFADFVVGFDHGCRFNKHRFARGRFIVDDTFDFAFQGGCNGNN